MVDELGFADADAANAKAIDDAARDALTESKTPFSLPRRLSSVSVETPSRRTSPSTTSFASVEFSNAKASSSVAGARFSNAGPACAATTLSACAAQRCDASEKKGVPSSSAAATASADANGRWFQTNLFAEGL